MRLGAVMVIAAAVLTAACSSGVRPEVTDVTLPPTTTSSPPTTTTEAPVPVAVTVPAPNGRVYPSVPDTVEPTAARIFEVEELLHSLDPTDPGWPDLAHEQQMLYRSIGRHPQWIPEILASHTNEFSDIVSRHIAARRAISGIGSGGSAPVNVPAWEIVDPLPAAELLDLYMRAELDSGIDWTFLAAINLIETGFGRINGLSTAGAQGPMQFLPTTWEEVSDGDINDPNDAIPAAASYLVRRGGPDDMHAALLGYNNSASYVAAVTHYAVLFEADSTSFLATHAWEIHYSSAAGDLWMPIGYRREESLPAVDHIIEAPWSALPQN